MTEEPLQLLGYVCNVCGWWIQYLSQEDEHCRHLVIDLVEHLTPEEIVAAKERTAFGKTRADLAAEPGTTTSERNSEHNA